MPFICAFIGFFIFPPFGAIIGFFIGCAFADEGGSSSSSNYNSYSSGSTSTSNSSSSNAAYQPKEVKRNFNKEVKYLYSDNQFSQIIGLLNSHNCYDQLSVTSKEKYLYSLFKNQQYSKYIDVLLEDSSIDSYDKFNDLIFELEIYSNYFINRCQSMGPDEIPNSISYFETFRKNANLQFSDLEKLRSLEVESSIDEFVANIYRNISINLKGESDNLINTLASKSLTFSSDGNIKGMLIPTTSALQEHEIELVEDVEFIIMNKIDFDELDDLKEQIANYTKNVEVFFIEDQMNIYETLAEEEKNFSNNEKQRLLKFLNEKTSEAMALIDSEDLTKELLALIREEANGKISSAHSLNGKIAA
jgi:hypothetical protein